jgi:hypothetical protein
MANDTSGPEGAAAAVASAKKTLADTHKHFGDNPDYAPKAPVKNVYAIPHQARQASGDATKSPTTMQEYNERQANADNLITHTPDSPIR